ncbi:MAG: RNA-binding S4 domain-containing protein [Paracoccaceae bacterium]
MAGPGARPVPGIQPRLRLDKWLWHARFFKSRSLAAEIIEDGHCRVNGNRTGKPGHGVGIGDVLTFAQGARIRVVRIQALGLRRGSAPEAQRLYLDLDCVVAPDALE